jgi:hypothetical protein
MFQATHNVSPLCHHLLTTGNQVPGNAQSLLLIEKLMGNPSGYYIPVTLMNSKRAPAYAMLRPQLRT